MRALCCRADVVVSKRDDGFKGSVLELMVVVVPCRSADGSESFIFEW